MRVYHRWAENGRRGVEPLFRMLNRRDSTLWRSLVSHEKAADGITSASSKVAQSPWSGLCSPFRMTHSPHFGSADSPLG